MPVMNKPMKNQNGIALVVGLVMLLVLTILGIASMSTTTQELKVACNFQTHSDAFQEAMSCSDEALILVDKSAAFPQVFECEIPAHKATAKATVDYLGCRVAPGSSLKVGANENLYDIDVTATATGCGGEAYSHMVQAIAVRVAEKCETSK